ncbi:FtsQ-type POTRA domain-containing protein [Saccharibacillus sp. CPCC 101409]|uniref:cell division protein FtsQ/DivIB n=1 Tax=Saccharibacillus sp. CPCC 101409 TaxID=3058041 RepID=UPI002672EE91|nr:FtsQ-type POTRA domain-containing protein [Saccharibacillus sp. CPCC 101409]MDO3409213.1 FtsQ-type POTRA domain-containing protein [Saccharibacillus sp. CPCC 101409]
MLKVVKPTEHHEQQEKPNPKPRRRGRWKLWLTIAVLLLAVLSVLFFRSSLSRIQQIEVEGNVYVDRSAIIEAAGLRIGNQFFSSSVDSVQRRIVSNLSAVESATVEKRFPGTIVLKVNEYDPVAYELLDDGTVQALLGSGAQVQIKDQGLPAEKPLLTEWAGKDEEKAQLCRVLATIPDSQLSDLSEIMPSQSVSYPDQIRIYTRSRFEVITTVSLLKDKLQLLGGIVELQGPGTATLLDSDNIVPFVDPEAETETEETP